MIRTRWAGALAGTVLLLLAGCRPVPLTAADGADLGTVVAVDDAGRALAVGHRAGATVTAVLDVATGARTELPAPEGAALSGVAVAPGGTVVGDVVRGQGRQQVRRPFVWTADSGITELPAPDGTYLAFAVDVDDAGRVLVNAANRSPSAADGTYLWSPGSGWRRLAEPPAGDGAPGVVAATALAPDGGAVGWTTVGATVPGGRRPLRWDTAGIPRILPLPAGLAEGELVGVDGSAVALGTAHGAAGAPAHAVLWRPDGSAVDLGEGSVAAVSAGGLAAGTAGSFPGRAAVWVLPSGTRLLVGPEHGDSSATAVNDHGLVLGALDGAAVRFAPD